MQPTVYTSSENLGSRFLKIYWLFQAIFAGPISATLAASAVVRLSDTHVSTYGFVTQVSIAMLAGAIVFVVLIRQRTPANKVSNALTLYFEILQSTFATSRWTWLMSDARFWPENGYDYYKRGPPIGFSAVALIALL